MDLFPKAKETKANTPNRQREGPAARRRLQGKEAIDGAGSGAGQGGRPRGQGQAAPGRLRFVYLMQSGEACYVSGLVLSL